MARKFASKVLVFGEYAVVHGGEALAVPNQVYQAFLDYGHAELEVQALFSDFLGYLERDHPSLYYAMDHQEFEEDIELGMFLNSNIPIGYGVGSSGALVAAIFHKYFSDEDAQDLKGLRRMLGDMESYFHGESSGFDPLISYLNQAIHLQTDGTMVFLDQEYERLLEDICLIDTGISRSTQPLVKIFNEKMKDSYFRESVLPQLKEVNSKTIQAFNKGEKQELIKYWNEISKIQYKHFKEMIPADMQTMWKTGLDEENFLVKLCGAGGGGFLLCYIVNRKAEGMLKINGINPVFLADR